MPESSLPASLLVNWLALTVTPAWLEISPARLSMPLVIARFSAFVAPTRPPVRLSRSLALSVRLPWAVTRPCWLFSAATVALRSAWLAITPLALLRSPASSCRALPLNVPFWLFKAAPALAFSVRPAFSWWPLLSSAWVTVAVRSRLATTLPALRRFCALSTTSPLALRLLSALTPASTIALLVNCPPAFRLMRSRAATFCCTASAPDVCTSTLCP